MTSQTKGTPKNCLLFRIPGIPRLPLSSNGTFLMGHTFTDILGPLELPKHHRKNYCKTFILAYIPLYSLAFVSFLMFKHVKHPSRIFKEKFNTSVIWLVVGYEVLYRSCNGQKPCKNSCFSYNVKPQ